MRWLLLFAVVTSIACGDDGRNPYLNGGGGGGGGNTGSGIDGGGLDGSTGVPFPIRLCAITDVRDPGLCATYPTGLSVQAEGVEGTSDDDGRVELLLSSEPTVVTVYVTGDTTYRSTIWVGPPSQTELLIPVFADDTMTGIESTLGEGPSDNVGIVIAYLEDGGEPIAGASIAGPVAGSIGNIYYDSSDPPYLDLGAGTGVYGIAAHFGLPVGAAEVTLSVKASSGSDMVDLPAPVSAGAITFVRHDFAL